MKKETIDKARKADRLIAKGLGVTEAFRKTRISSNTYYAAKAEGLFESPAYTISKESKAQTFHNPALNKVVEPLAALAKKPQISPKRPPKTVATSPKKSGVLTLVVGEISLYCFKLRLFKFSRD